MAAQNGYLEGVRLLLEVHANVNAQDGERIPGTDRDELDRAVNTDFVIAETVLHDGGGSFDRS